MHPRIGFPGLPALLCVASLVATGCGGGSRSVIRTETIAPPPVERRVATRLAERHFTDGSLLGMRERHSEAIAEYRRALAFDTTRGSIYYAIGKSFRALNEIDSAIRYTRIASQRGGALEVFEQLADLMMISGDVDGAIAQYDSMIARDPNHLQSRYMAARLLQRRDPARARAHFEYILRNLTDDTDVMLRLTELYLDEGNVDGAIELMERMVLLEPTSSELHQMTTTLLLDAARYGAAIESVRRAEAQLPAGSAIESYFLETLREADDRLGDERAVDDSLEVFTRELVTRAAARAESWSVRLFAGTVAIGIGEAARAEVLFARALSDTSATAQTWSQIATTYLDAGDPVTGIRIVAGSVSRFEDDFRVPFLFGLLHEAAGDTDSAIIWLKRSVATYDDHAEAWAALGRIYARLERHSASDAAYEKSIDADPENAHVLNDYAWSLALRGARLDRALELVVRALEYEPENESFLDTRGWIHFRRGELDEALGDLQRAVSAGGADAGVYEHLGDVLRARGDDAGARAAYERAAELDAGREGIDERLRSVR